MSTPLIQDDQRLVSARYKSSGTEIPIYDDGFGPLFIHRHSIGVSGIVRAQSWEDAYSICEDEFFPEADENTDELVKEYGFKREQFKVVKAPGINLDATTRHPQLGAEERFAVYPDDYPEGKLAPMFVRWETVETPDPDAWCENELFQEAYGFRNNGPNKRDVIKHGIYSKDLNGDSLDVLTPELASELGIEITTEEES